MTMDAVETSHPSSILGLFQGFGLELEYMIVNRLSLDVLPIADELIYKVCGDYRSDVEKEPISWSNEIALHLIELKTGRPADSLEGLDQAFQNDIRYINRLLSSFEAMLLPTAMHPWMDPHSEMKLWPHENNLVYESFHRIFNCTGHGWANLQSAHLNLPFANEKEFEKLHAAIRLILPLIPAIAASSPIVESRLSGLLDTRLDVYRSNAIKIPSITAHVIPEVCRTFQEYNRHILQKIYADIGPYDPQGILQKEWLNARGSIARFERNTIEIRLVDVQEAPQADVAIAVALSAAIKALVNERWTTIGALHQFHEEALKLILLDTIREGENAMINDKPYLQALGWKKGPSCKASELWGHLIESTVDRRSSHHAALKHILTYGTLASRIRKAVGPCCLPDRLHEVYKTLAEHLEAGTLFSI